MAEKYNASKRIKTVAYKLGEAVTVKVPVQDRGPCDLNRIPGIIVEEKNGFHKIKTQYGVLKNQYRTDELERCRSLSTDEEWGNDETITLREAARRFNRREGEVSVCTCKSGCGNKRCKCFKQNLKCTTRCHSGQNCANKGIFLHVTESFKYDYLDPKSVCNDPYSCDMSKDQNEAEGEV